ncbi:hypothetical protein L0F63_005511 [Massospora cicadina]|nr:hypothetical protein L0F63_005511 [Massospora cicadina]
MELFNEGMPLNSDMYAVVVDAVERTRLVDDHVDLISEEIGGTEVATSDQTFGKAINLIRRQEPNEGPSGIRLQLNDYDGWETRRNNPSIGECEYAIFRLPFPGTIRGFSLNTIGIRISDLPKEVKLEAMVSDKEEWDVLLGAAKLEPNSLNFFWCTKEAATIYNQVRITIFREGGLARLRVYGTVSRPLETSIRRDPIDVAFVGNGARVIEASQCEVGDRHHLIMPGAGNTIHDGWLTPRSQEDENEEYVLIALARPSLISYLDLHTNGYEGMQPQTFQVFGGVNKEEWIRIGDGMVCKANLRCELKHGNLFTHILLLIYPGGGVMRVRVMGWFVILISKNGYKVTPEQEERLATYRIERGVADISQPIHRLEDNGDVNHPNNTPAARNLYTFLFVVNELKEDGIESNYRALCRLITHLNCQGTKVNPNRLVATLKLSKGAITPEDLEPLPIEMKCDLIQDEPYRVSTLPDDTNLIRKLTEIVSQTLADLSSDTHFVLHVIRTLNPANLSTLQLPNPLEPLIEEGYKIEENIALFKDIMNSDAFVSDPNTHQLLDLLTRVPT